MRRHLTSEIGSSVLTWVSVYWFSKAGPAASVRIYYEYVNMPVPTAPPTIPRGLSFFPRELILVPKVYVVFALNRVDVS